MSKDKWIWMPHAGHFICGYRCQFRLNTYVNGYIISTVGEMPKLYGDRFDWETVGLDRLYETMVFKARRSKYKCCPYEMTGNELDFEPYNIAEDAYKGHLKMCEKWDKL